MNGLNMRRKSIIGLFAIGLFAGSMAFTATTAAVAEEQDNLDRLVEITPGATRDYMLKVVEDAAQRDGVPVDTYLEGALAEAEWSIKAAGSTKVMAMGGGGDEPETVALPTAGHTGDIFVTPASTFTTEHGHIGIYSTRTHIVEAPGFLQDSREILASIRSVNTGGVLQHVRTDAYQADRTAAAQYAASDLVDKPYNIAFTNNKSELYATHYNCSQLVWAAYKATSGLGVDGNGGNAVYPYDIQWSGYPHTYRNI